MPQSLPSRERGLKLNFSGYPGKGKPSLPSRERGLKFALDYSVVYCDTSLPSRERGLKFLKLEISFLRNSVAPFAGAWIEIDESESED